MDLRVNHVMIPVALLNAFNTIAVLITIPILDRLVYPFFRRIGRPLSYLQRIGKYSYSVIKKSCLHKYDNFVEKSCYQQTHCHICVSKESY